MKQYWKVGLAAAIMLAIAGTVTGIVAAQTAGPTPDTPTAEDQSTPDGDSVTATPKSSDSDASDGKSDRRDAYLDALADNLGVSRDELDQALKGTALDMVDKAVADGKLTQDEADTIKERINSGDFPGMGPGFGFGHGFEKGFGKGVHVGVKVDDLADFLGIDVATLHQNLQDGQSLAQIAEANGKTRDELKAHMTANAKERLEQAVADGDMTQDEADAKLQNINDMLDSLIDQSGPLFRGGRGFHHRDGAGPFGGYDDDGGDGSSTPDTETSSLL